MPAAVAAAVIGRGRPGDCIHPNHEAIIADFSQFDGLPQHCLCDAVKLPFYHCRDGSNGVIRDLSVMDDSVVWIL